MDRWAVRDEQSLRLLGHPGGLTRTGGRPRFTLTPEEVRRLGCLREIGTALELLFGDAGPWLKQPSAALPFNGQTPLDYMIARGMAGIVELPRFLARAGLSRALGP